jgi:hypothetical protein
MSEDEQYLRLLSIFHYVVGGIAALFACFPIFHFTNHPPDTKFHQPSGVRQLTLKSGRPRWAGEL